MRYLKGSALRSIYDLDSGVDEIITLLKEVLNELEIDGYKNHDEIIRVTEIKESVEHTKRQELQLTQWAYLKRRK